MLYWLDHVLEITFNLCHTNGGQGQSVEQKTVWFHIYYVTDLNWQQILGGAALGYYSNEKHFNPIVALEEKVELQTFIS